MQHSSGSLEGDELRNEEASSLLFLPDEESPSTRSRSPQRSRSRLSQAGASPSQPGSGNHKAEGRQGTIWQVSSLQARCRHWLTDAKARTTVLVNLSAIMERTDEQLLPAVYLFVAVAFSATPKQLGYLTLCRAVVQAFASPLGGFMGHYYNRIWVIAAGCTLWGIMTLGFSFCTSVQQGYLFWAMNGIGLSLVIPSGQSLTADYFSEASRGTAFGALYLTGALGAMLGALYATNLGCHHPLGMEGWRFAFVSVAFVSLGIGALTFCFGHDPRFVSDKQVRVEVGADKAAGEGSFWQLLKETRTICTVPTFVIIITQGIMGSMPWNALVFFTLYLQLLGMSDAAASGLMAVFLGGTAVGGLLGGWVGDKAADKYPQHGRILACQYSVGSGVPFALLLLKGLPFNGASATVAAYALVLFLMGLSISWAAPACNNPIFAEIVPPHMRNMIYAFDRSFEGAIAACGAPLVGILAERMFGFTGAAATTTHCGDRLVGAPDAIVAAAASAEELSRDLVKAHALGNALLVSLVVPWALCFLFYSGLHFTYPLDRRRALAEDPANSKSSTVEMMSQPAHESSDGGQHVRLNRREGDKGISGGGLSSVQGALAHRGSSGKGDDIENSQSGHTSWHDSFE
ncbi:hypothetical protein WJX73_003542 [Symbiochloris irregularis]|uniref:Major facilitator superfamily (MFS) profile domain-containing protein n=1 Tax=Symbiochloris irregularis TaxID=706552 RepID=A0AAW1NHR5_9CHLO